MMRYLIVPLAAFAVTATVASAFGGGIDLGSLDIGLTDTQVAALEHARQIRESASAEAQSVLLEAGIDEETMREIHKAAHDAMRAKRDAMHSALAGGDYQAFLDAIQNTPLASTIDTEAEFQKFKEAFDLKQSGDFESARAIMDDLGVTGPSGSFMGPRGHGFGHWGHKEAAEG